MTSMLMWAAARRLGVALVMCLLAAPPTRADTIPPDLASLAAQVYHRTRESLRSETDDPRKREASERALAALRRAGLPYWARDPVAITDGARTVAVAVGLDLSKDADLSFARDLLRQPLQERRRALSEFYKRRGIARSDADIDKALGAIDAARAAGKAVRSHSIDLGDGERVELVWKPETGEMVVHATGAASAAAPEYDVALLGRTTFEPDRDTGNLQVSVTPAERPSRVVTAEEIARIRASILGEWTDARAGDVYRISATEPKAGDIRPTREQFEQQIAALKERRSQLQGAKEYVWEDPGSKKIVRQQSFRRLGEPWVFRGERPTVANAAAQIAALDKQISQIEADRDGASRPPVDQHDPVGLEANRKAANARPIRIEVKQRNGHTYTYDQASFDGSRIAAKRTYRHVRDINQQLPAPVKQQLIASWSPPGWLEAQASVDPATGNIIMSGNFWGLHVTYSSGLFGAGEPKVERIHTPYPTSVELTKAGTNERTAWGAAANVRP